MSISKLASVLLAVCMAFMATIARADSQVRIVRLSYVEGDVQIDRGGGGGFERAFLNMPLISGNRLWTGDDARAEVEFEEGSTLRIMPATRIELSELSRRDSGWPSTSIGLQEGTAYFNLNGKDKEEFNVTFGGREVRLAKSARFRIQLHGNEAKLAVFKGELKVSTRPSGDWLEVRKNQTLTLDLDDASRNVLAKEILPEHYDDWDKERDAYRDRYASASDNLPYRYGFGDLNSYGNFLYVPPYGYLWRPALVSAAWNPFADGAWVWYPGFGYMWVSGYPWGWAPYHYGSWLFISGYGWCWNPRGASWAWNGIPRVVDPPHGFNPPRPPGPGGGTGVVTVGRGPAFGNGNGDPRARRPGLDGADRGLIPADRPGRQTGPGTSSSSQPGAPITPNTIRTDGNSTRGHQSGSPSMTPIAPSAPARSAPNAAPGSMRDSGGGSHSSAGNNHGGSHPRSTNPR